LALGEFRNAYSNLEAELRTADHQRISQMNRGYGRLLCRRCGWCCQNQLIGVSTVEIRAIADYLQRKIPEQVEDHIVSCLAYEGTLSQYELGWEKRRERLTRFFDPCEVIVFGKTTVVKTHVIQLLQESRRCLFHNPVSSDCFIYPARPLTCRMFPYEVEKERLVMVDETDECPGAGFGEPVNMTHHTRLSKMCRELLTRDDAVFWGFVQEKELTREGSPVSHLLHEHRMTHLQLIDPFVELGLIPGPAGAR
jgi:Fe-S-cluster containining protein